MSEPLEVHIDGADNQVIRGHYWSAGDRPERALVLAPGATQIAELEREFAQRLAGEACAVLVVERGSGDGATDRRCTADLDAAGGWLVEAGAHPDGLAIAGFARGGTLAFLTACESTRFQAVISFDGPIVYPELGQAQPVQPHEMALNLGAPYLAHVTATNPALPAEDVALLRSKLDAFAKTYEVFEYERAPWGEQGAGADGQGNEAAQLAWGRTVAFLDEVL